MPFRQNDGNFKKAFEDKYVSNPQPTETLAQRATLSPFNLSS